MNRIRILIIQALNPSYGSGGWAEQAKLGIRVQGGSRTPDDRIVDGLQKAKVLSAIDTLPKIQGAWLRYGYGPQALFDKREIVRHLLARPYKADAAEKWLELADVAVDDARTRITSEAVELYRPWIYTGCEWALPGNRSRRHGRAGARTCWTCCKVLILRHFPELPKISGKRLDTSLLKMILFFHN